ncbi:MAG TPA: DUF1501 domain-containing protein [Rhizomicrobium sp.]|nr:DUF1501 domain-containing protein [Rhizomicrobium sp.]
MRRRDFLTAAGALSGLAFTRIGAHAWAAQNPNAGPQRLVVVLLRGAVDGLNVVVPYNEHDYYAMRPSIAVPPPGHQGGGLDLDGQFAAHPQLEPLMPLWKEKSLAFVHACGSPDPSRSHFEAQAYMETGTPGVKTTTDGWLNRALAALPGQHPPTEAVNFGATMPRILHGSMAVASLPNAGGRGSGASLDTSPLVHSAFDSMYSGADSLSVAYREGQSAHSRLMGDLEREMTVANGGAPSPAGFAKDVAHFCTIARQDPTIQVGFFALGGWDTHTREGSSSEGQLAKGLRQLAQGLAGFRKGLGDAGYERTVVLVMSEFGRTARENGNAGTDHGHGNAMWVLGGAVRGGKVYGQWPGLSEAHLRDGRDLAVTTDFRTVAGSVLAQHMKLLPSALAHVFPNAPAGSLPVIA